MRRRHAGLTLMEVLVAMSLLSLLSAGILMALRVGARAWESANTNLTLDRRIATANQILHSALEQALPALAEYTRPQIAAPQSFVFFQGGPQSMRFVTAYSLEAGPRGGLRIWELQVIEGPKGKRVLLNDRPYGGPRAAGTLVASEVFDPSTREMSLLFAPIQAQPSSFILADELQDCRFSYLAPEALLQPRQWVPVWVRLRQLPEAVSVQLGSHQDSPRLRPVTATVPIRARLSPL